LIKLPGRLQLDNPCHRPNRESHLQPSQSHLARVGLEEDLARQMWLLRLRLLPPPLPLEIKHRQMSIPN